MNNVFAQISKQYYQLTASEKKVADLVISEELKTQFMSISQLAAASDVAEATVSRFARQLGYKNFNAFKLAIANSKTTAADFSVLANEVNSDDSFDLLKNKLLQSNIEILTQTKNLINHETILSAAHILLAADKVLCMGQGGSMILAQEAAHLFTTAHRGYFAVQDSHIQAITATHLTPNDAVLYFSYSGGTKDLIDILKIVRKRHAKSILVTRFPNSPGAMLADVVLQCGSNENPLQLGSIGARISQLFLIEALFTEMYRHDENTYRKTKKDIADVLAEKHV